MESQAEAHMNTGEHVQRTDKQQAKNLFTITLEKHQLRNSAASNNYMQNRK